MHGEDSFSSLLCDLCLSISCSSPTPPLFGRVSLLHNYSQVARTNAARLLSDLAVSVDGAGGAFTPAMVAAAVVDQPDSSDNGAKVYAGPHNDIIAGACFSDEFLSRMSLQSDPERRMRDVLVLGPTAMRRAAASHYVHIMREATQQRDRDEATKAAVRAHSCFLGQWSIPVPFFLRLVTHSFYVCLWLVI